MVAVKTGLTTPPPMPGMPAPMQPMMPMGGPGTFPAASLPAGQTPIPAAVPPMPLAGFPPPPVKPPMAQPQQQGSNAPRRRRFGDSLEGMLSRNMFAPQQPRPLPMPQRPPQMMPRQQMVAPGTPMMRTPTPRPMQMGGAVPRQTTIAGQPHGLAYINQDEEALLRSFGGSGIAGPGGIPSYPPQGVTSFGGASDAPSSFDSGYSSNYKSAAKRRREKAAAAEKAAAIQQIKDAEAAALAAQQTTSAQSYSAFDDDYEDYTPTSDQLNQQLSDAGQTNITTNFSNVNYDTTSSGQDYDTAAQADTDVSGFEYAAAGGLGQGDSGVYFMPEPITLGSDDPVVFTDIMGKTYSNPADRDRANLGYQQASYQQGSQALRGLSQAYKQFGNFDSDEEAYRRAAASYAVDPPETNVYNLQNVPDIFTNMFPPQRQILPPKVGDDDDTDDKTTSDDGTSRVSNLLELEPAEGGYSLVDLKKRISLAEGTSDAGGYDRLLGGTEDRFGIKPTEMTVQEVLDFQLARGEGTYADYATRNVGRISTPVGKYQIVGSTLQGLVNQGILDPNEKFDVNAQERAATHLITTDLADGKGLEDLKTGDMTVDEFEDALGKQFEGIELGLDKKAIPTIDDTESSIIPASNTTSTTEQINIFDPIDPQDKGKEKEYQFNLNLGGSDKDDESGKTVSDQDKELPTFIPAEKVEQITSYTNKDGQTIVDDPDTPQNEAVIAQLGLGSSLASGRDIGVPNAAEAAFLMEALNEMEFDDKGNLVGAEPNFLEETLGKIIKNLTIGAFDPNDPQKREDALAILDNYEKTGKFVYDGKEMSIDELIKASKDEGIEPAVIGVESPDEKTVGFTDGTGFRNIMGDYDPVYKDGQIFSGGSDTQNIKTGSTDVFGGGDTTTNITTGGGDDGGGDDDGGSDTGVDTGHTVDDDGNIVCNTEGYVYNPETKKCELPKEEEDDGTPGSGIGTGTSGESFEDVLKRVVVAAPDVAPISANVQPMQEGGMAGLNRAADNFLKALAG